MLKVAAAKGLYSKTILADLTKDLAIADASYGAIVSSGTFTHGHVGPDALDALLRVAQQDAVFVLSINGEHFEQRGFATKFAALEPHIRDLEHRIVNIYGPGADAAHRADTAHVSVFYKR